MPSCCRRTFSRKSGEKMDFFTKLPLLRYGLRSHPPTEFTSLLQSVMFCYITDVKSLKPVSRKLVARLAISTSSKDGFLPLVDQTGLPAARGKSEANVICSLDSAALVLKSDPAL